MNSKANAIYEYMDRYYNAMIVKPPKFTLSRKQYSILLTALNKERQGDRKLKAVPPYKGLTVEQAKD